MKCSNSVVAINQLRDGLFTMLTKTGMLYYCHTKHIIFLEKFTNISELRKLSLDLRQDINRMVVPEALTQLKGSNLYCGSVCVIHGHLLIVTQRELMLCEVLDSLALHQRFCVTENILLLYYLLLLRYSPSPFLKPPDDFTGMELEFPRSCPESKQVLLEYYYLMDIQPPDDFAEQAELN